MGTKERRDKSEVDWIEMTFNTSCPALKNVTEHSI